MDNCSDKSNVCFQVNVRYENGSDKHFAFSKGCVGAARCEEYKKGDIGFCNSLKQRNFTNVQCIGECCYGDECNKGNLFAHSKATALNIMSVIWPLSGLLLALVNAN